MTQEYQVQEFSLHTSKIQKVKKYIPFTILIAICLVFFYKTIFLGLIPFPGDLLVAEYSPWKQESFLGYVPGSMPNRGQYFDVLRQLYPWKTLVIDSMKSGQLPLWNPYNFSGSPLLANIQSAVFYPLNIFYFLLPQKIAWTILVMLQPLLGSIGMYLFVRKKGLSAIASLLSGVSYGYGLFMTVFLEYNTIGHVVMLLPFSLYTVELLSEKKTVKRSLLFIATISVGFFAGHLQLAVVNCVFVFLYMLFHLHEKNLMKNLLVFILLFFIACGIAAIQLFPTIELLINSARSSQEHAFLVRELLIQPYQLIKFFSPDIFGNPATKNYLLTDPYPGKALYIGFIPLIFAAFSLFSLKKNKDVLFFVSSICTLLFFLIASPFTSLFYSLSIPFFSSSSPGNMIYIISFGLAFLAGYGVEAFLKMQQRKIFLVSLGILILFAVLFAYIFISGQQYVVKNLFYTLILLITAFFFFTISRWFNDKKKYVVVVFLVITVADLFYFFQKFNPFVHQGLVFPKTSVTSWLAKRDIADRMHGLGSGTIEANFATQYHFFSPDGYDPLYPKWYGSFLHASKDGHVTKTFTNKTRSDAIISPTNEADTFLGNVWRKKIIDMLGVVYILDRVENGNTEKAFPQIRFTPLYVANGWKILRNNDALPRVALFSQYRVATSDDDFSQTFFSPDFDPKQLLFLTEPLSEKLQEGAGKATVTRYEPNTVTIQTQAQGRKLLFLSDTYMPGWEATIDGEETKIYRANYAFRAVVVPEGEHEVIFSYKPRSFSFGAVITILSMAVFGGYAFWHSRKRNKNA